MYSNTKNYITNSETIDRVKPVNIKREDQKYFTPQFTYTPPQTFTWQKANVLISNLYHLQKGITLLQESFRNANHIKSLSWIKRLYVIFKNAFLIKNEVFPDKGIYAINPWSTFYYHWFAETLPRLYSQRDKIKDRYLILPYRFKNYDFIEPSLELFQFKGIKYLKKDQNLLVKDLLYISEVAKTGEYNTELTLQLNTDTREYISNLPKLNFGERIYITRKKAAERKVINDKQFIDCISKFGFKEVVFEDYSWEEQASIAYHASVMIGPHGGGLTNALFMPPKSTLIELRPKGHFFFNCFYTLADALSHNYYYLTCDTDNPSNTHASNFIVDIPRLEQTLQQIIND